MGSLERRIDALERLYHMSGESPEEEQRQRQELRGLLQSAREQASQEALETGDRRRLVALEDVERHLRDRVERRRREGGA